MKIINIESGPVYTNSYLIWDEQSKEGAVIDAPPDICEEFLQKMKENGINLQAILFTHTHWDHTADVGALHEATGASVYVHKDDEFRLLAPMEHSIFPLPFELKPFNDSKYLSDSQLIEIGSISIQVLHTPGHTEGGVCFVLVRDKIVFTGDSLFLESIGRTDLPGGNADVLLNSIKNKILALPDDYIVYPGHGPSTTIRYEKLHNPFLN
jgi:hydroxyacylglutathione hydrolase